MSKAALFEARNKLTDFVRRAEAGESIELTRHGKTVAVLVGIDEFASLKQSEMNFARSFSRYRQTWNEALCAETPSAYEDPFETVRSREIGRSAEL